MKPILKTKVYNAYRSKTPKGFYHPVRGHSGVDLAYVHEDIPAPCDLTILKIAKQNEMGNVIYAIDKNKYIHVFAHQKDFICQPNDVIKKDQLLGHSGNTGSRTTAPHLHYEILAPSGTNPEMKREGLMYPGDNIDPLKYLQSLPVTAENLISTTEKEAILTRARQKRQMWSGVFNKVKSLFTKP